MRKLLLIVLILGLITSMFGLRQFVGAWPYTVPNVAHYNMFVTNALSFGTPYNELMWLRPAFYLWAEGKYVPLLAVDWYFLPPDNPGYFFMTIRNDAKWSDGTPITAKDVWSTYMLGYLVGWNVWNYISDVEIMGDYTVAFKLTKPSLVVERLILRTPIYAYKTFKEWADKVAELRKEGKDRKSDEMKDLLIKFRDFRPKEILYSGPFMLDTNRFTEAEAYLIRNPQYFDKDTVKIDEIKLYRGELAQIVSLVLAQEIDYATHAFPPATEQQFKAMGIMIIRPPLGSGPALVFNHKIYPFNLKKFRQALAYAIDRDQCGYVSMAESGKGVKFMAGMSDNMVKVWMKPEDIAKLNRYEYNPAKAEQMLKELGFTRGKDGIWRDDKGNKLEFELLVPAEWVDWVAAGENVASQLEKFGIKLTVRGVTWTQQPRDVREGKFQLAIQLWGTGNPIPYYAFWNDFLRLNHEKYRGGIGTNEGMAFYLENVETECCGKVNVYDLVMNSVVGVNKEKIKRDYTKLALIFNETLPMIPLWERYGNNPALDGVRVTGWPPVDDTIYKNNPYNDSFVTYMILNGTLKGIEK